MTTSVDVHGARHDRAGRYATKPFAEAECVVLADPDPVVCGLDDEMAAELFRIANDLTDSNAGRQVRAQDFTAWLAADTPGLADDERERLTGMLIEDLEAARGCRQALATPGLENTAAIAYRMIPRSLRDRVSPQFSVTEADPWIDESTGELAGRQFTRRANPADWAEKMERTALATARRRIELARNLSDERHTTNRTLVVQPALDPWRTSYIDADSVF